MSSKKKIIISISSFALVLIAVAAAIIAVIAAQQITISSQISVNYINKNVYGRASASYAVKYADQEDFEEFETFVYLDTEEPDNNQDDTVEVTLEEGDIIQFKFDFTNADPNDVPYVATLTLPTIKNFKVTIYNGTKDLTCSNIYDSEGFLDEGWADAWGAISGTGDPIDNWNEFTIVDSEYILITFEVEDTTTDASISGSFDWIMEK